MFNYIRAMKHIYSFHVVFCQRAPACQSLNEAVVTRMFPFPLPHYLYTRVLKQNPRFYLFDYFLPIFYMFLLMVMPF